MHAIRASVCAALAAALADPATVAAQVGLTPAAARKIDRQIRDVLGRQLDADFVGVVAIGRGGELAVVERRGRIDGKPVDERTPFDIGKLAEVFTAVALQRLAMDGALRLDDPITDYLVGPESTFRRLSIRELLEHTSGLPEMDLSRDDARSRDAFVLRATSRGVEVRPGLRHRDNRLDYGMLAAVVERAGKKPFEHYVRGELWAPADLRDASFAVDDGRPWAVLGRGGVRASARDLHAWFVALWRGRIIDSERLDELAHATSGRAVFETELASDERSPRTRAADDADRAAVSFYRLQDTVVVLVGNGRVDRHALEDALEAVVVDKSVTSGALQRYVGSYRVGTDEHFEVALDGERLLLRSLGQTASSRLRHGQPKMPEWPKFYDEVEQRLAILIRPLFERDLESFARGFHAGAVPNAAPKALQLLDKLEQRHGRLGRHAVIGTAVEGGTTSYVRVPFGEDHRVTLAVVWHGQELQAVQLAERDWPFEVVLVPTEDDEFAATTLDGKARLRVRFRGASGKPARTLLLYDDSKSGRRGIRAKRVR